MGCIHEVSQVLQKSYQMDHLKPPPSLLRDLEASVASGTANNYAPKWKKFTEWCAKNKLSALPACEWTVSTYLSQASDQDQTYDPTKKRAAAIIFFHTLANLQPPCEKGLGARIRDGIRKRLGQRRAQKHPLTRAELLASLCLAENSGKSKDLFVARICVIMHEAQVRWDDIVDIVLGDIVFSSTYVRLLIVGSKSDPMKEGQWGMISVSDDPTSAFKQLCTMLEAGLTAIGKAPQEIRSTLLERQARMPYPSQDKSAISTFPVHIKQQACNMGLNLENLPLLGSWLWCQQKSAISLIGKMRYSTFLSLMKTLLSPVVRDSKSVATHSLRRGGTTQKIADGLEPRLVKFLGRWRTEKAFEGYIGERVTSALCADAIESSRSECWFTHSFIPFEPIVFWFPDKPFLHLLLPCNKNQTFMLFRRRPGWWWASRDEPKGC